METFVSIVGWTLSAIFFLGALFVFGCSRTDKKNEDGTWKIYFLAAIFLFLVAAYCATTACMIS